MIILIIILIIIILLTIGIKITFNYNKTNNETKGCLKILIFKKIKIYTLELPSQNENNNNNPDIKKIFELAKPCFEDLKNYLKTVIKNIKIRKINNHLIFGMTSYADTGKYIGIIWAILAIINPLHENIQLSAEPRFAGSVLECHGINEVEIYPLKLLIPTIKLILKKEVRILIKGVVNDR